MTNNDLTRREFTRLAAIAAALPAAGVAACTDSGQRGDASPGAGAGGGADAAEGTEADVAPWGGRVAWAGYGGAMIIDALASPGPFNVQNRMGSPLTDEMVANARASGITAVNVTVSGGGGDDYERAFSETTAAISYFEREIEAHPDVFMKIRSVADLQTAKETGRVGLILGFQDTTSLASDLSRLELFHGRGVRIIQLTYNVRNLVGDGCLQPENGGLTEFGREVVARMNEMGILVDLGHVGVQTTADAIVASHAPVAITHSGCRAVYEHPRSKRDEELRSLADHGGVIGIYMMPFLNAEGPAQPEHLYQHIEHALQVCGEDHVGIGSDLSTTPTIADQAYLDGLQEFAAERQRLGIGAPRENEVLFVPELNYPERMGMIADGLLARGHTEAVVEKVVGGNWMRLFGEVWA